MKNIISYNGLVIFLGAVFLLLSCSREDSTKATPPGKVKPLTQFSAKELYDEMQARNKFTGEKKIVDTPPAAVNPNLAEYSDKELYEALDVVYGVDNRKNPYDKSITDVNIINNYKKVACLVNASQLQLQPDGNYRLQPTGSYTSYGGQKLCTEENFYGEPIAGLCTGFAVSKTMFATAGHCLNKDDLSSKRFIYGFEMKDSVSPNLLIKKEDVYTPIEIAGWELDKQTDNDYCIVKVKEEIPANLICSVRKTGEVPNSQKLYVIGYPSGLPVKITSDGNVYANDKPIYFVTNLDTYGGNSGSPVFNASTHTVEGILVRGARDYSFWNIDGCYRSNICPENIGSCNGEDVTRASQFYKWIK
jgi:hypothetical protein